MASLKLKNLSAAAQGQPIVSGVSLAIAPGEVHALMGPNGSGKSTLANALAGHPSCEITQGQALLGAKSLVALPPEARAKAGLFLSMQEPPEVGGIQSGAFLKKIIALHEPKKKERLARLRAAQDAQAAISPSKDLLGRLLNKGFSGGEKKKGEILQLVAMAPKFAILDEIDSGLDADSLAAVAEVIRKMARKGTGFLLISHYSRLFSYLKVDRVHVMKDGSIAKSGSARLLKQIDEHGFGKL